MANYLPVQQDENPGDLPFRDTEASPAMSRWSWKRVERSTQKSRTLDALSWTVQLVLFVTSAVMLYLARSRPNAAECLSMSTISSWSPALTAVEYESTIFRGSPYHLSPWKGQPNPELDALWTRVGQVGAMSITADEVRRLGKDPDYVIKWPEELGGGHFASVEVFHHLHCLNFLRKTTYTEYYRDIELSFTEGDIKLRRHKDHCIDILRQALMCNGDMTLMTYNWIKENPAPYPDFDTTHQCRNFTKLLEWGEATMIKAPANSVDPHKRFGVKVLDG